MRRSRGLLWFGVLLAFPFGLWLGVQILMFYYVPDSRPIIDWWVFRT